MIGIQKNLSTKLRSQVNKLSNLPKNYFHKPLHKLFQDTWLGHCLLCRQKAASTPCLCDGCKNDLEYTGITCARCFEPLSIPDQTLCPQCILSPPSFDLTCCFSLYEFPANTLVQYLKYQSQQFIAQTMASCMAVRMRETYGHATEHQSQPRKTLHQKSLQNRLDFALIYIPMHPKRIKQRGFNQACSIAKSIGRENNWPVMDNYLIKKHPTPNQASLPTRKARLKNLQGSFGLNESPSQPPRHILLIDDVMTTGATAEVASKLLKSAGVERVDVWCFARTPKR